jgi:hypothetical protein
VQQVAEGFGFLGYHIFLNASGGVTAVPREAAFEKLYDRLAAIDAGASSGADKMATVFSWRCAYAAWEGGDHGDDVLSSCSATTFRSISRSCCSASTSRHARRG